MQAGTIQNEVNGELSAETFKAIMQGRDEYNMQKLRQEYDRVEYQLRYSDCFRLWDIAELKFYWGIVNYLIARKTKEKYLVKDARDAFNFVMSTEHYRHKDCSTPILKCLMHACDKI